MGWTQTQKGKENKSRSIIDDSSRNKEVAKTNMDIAEGDPFWKGFEAEQRGIEEWIKKQREEGSTKKKRRIKMCRSVYAKSRAVGVGSKSKKGKRKQRMQDAEGRTEPSFLPCSKGNIAGDSVGDSEIQNCNRCLKKQVQNHLALEIWDLAKKLGAVAEDDREIIQRIEELESRDSRDKAKMASHGSGGVRKMTWSGFQNHRWACLVVFCVFGILRSVSDHCPILLKEEKIDWGPKPFKFFDAWLEQSGCKETIRIAWNLGEINGGKGYKLKEKLKMTKKALKDWSSKSMADVDRKISESEKMIVVIDEQGEKNTLSDIDIEKRRNCFLELWKHLRIKERMWQQNSRMAWLKEGDVNTKFFHRCVKGRSRRNEINYILIKGKQHTGVLGIKKAVAEYFEELFTEEIWQRPRLDGISFNQISGEDNELLTALFSELEIKQAIWECSSSKSPGPDGFNFRFIKEMWEDIKSEIIDFVQEFHRLGRLVRGSNASFIVLIPKVENPQRIEEFIPISLIGVMYKIIAKLLSNRLQKVLPKIIGEQQMAFIGGRQLVDGVVIANEVIDEAKRKKKKSFLFKVDFEKAYDNVCWDFIDYMMRRMGFNTTWRTWIRECLTSSSVSVLINGSPTNQFPVSKGIRQGDPLSPFLFLIVAEGLNGLVSSAVEKQLNKGVAVGNEGVSVSHLQFADDTIFFREASEDNIGVIKSIMITFELVSGLKINFGKSQLMGVGVEDNWRNKMAYRLCCKERELPFKYLGIPIGGNHKRVAMWQPMVESFKKKLTTWKGRYLSLGGRITLINSVLSSLPVFLMSVYLIPKGKDNKCYQMGNDGNEQRGWNLQWRRKLFDWETEEAKELQQLIEDKRITHGRPDLWEWMHDKDGQYSTKTTYSILTKEQIETNEISTFRRIWNPKFPSKVSAFNWQLLLDRIPTKANLVIRGILGESKDGKCVFCKVEDEDSRHLFLKCKITRWVWQECAKWWGTEVRLGRDCWNSFQMFGKWSKDPKLKEGWDCIWSNVIWTVWLARNQMIFQDKKTDPRKLLEIIQVRSFQWITANLDKYAFTLSDWLINPVECLKGIHAGRNKRD
ncbi:hypothetical protein SLEP1_g53216 [Rubroshorea leprosula]|uniref:Reverse transcriptase domain-containing protein n=1 Tax=Rubroshorea leprosula TaxID=152421 RepID=A0AAV5M9V4_9ROSI|nr:hypothetical protein SLEP1_g53216 [Rubroshorea leprosula]